MAETGMRLGDIVAQLGGRLDGDPDARIETIATLGEAQPGTLSFLANPRYRSSLARTRATCVILGESDAGQCPAATIVTDDPYVYYARAAALLTSTTSGQSGRHPDATIAADAEVAASAWIGAQAVIGSGARIGEDVFVGPGCVVGEGVEIGRGSRLSANVTVIAAARVGAGCVFHPGVVIGGDGFGIAWDGERWLKVPQVGSVEIGDAVEIGANTAVDRGAIENTVIEAGVKLDNLIQIGHNVHIGRHTVIAGCVGVSGSAVIGSHCQIGGQVGVAGHISIADRTVVTGKTVVSHSIREPGGRYSGALPLDESRRWQRNSARFRSLDKMARRLIRLERLHKDRHT